jgi:hypothetical protein
MSHWNNDIVAGRDIVTRARKCIRNAEADLGKLTDGMKRDLLKDNFCVSHEEACLLVDFIN